MTSHENKGSLSIEFTPRGKAVPPYHAGVSISLIISGH